MRPKTDKSATDKRAKKDDGSNPHPAIRVLKTASCPNLRHSATLTYEVGADAGGEIHLRVTRNSCAGRHGREWVALRALQQALAKASGPVTSSTLRKVFAGKSANSCGFALACLVKEGLVEPLADARGYAPTDGVEFMSEVKALLERGPARASVDPAKATTPKPSAPKPLKTKALSTSRAKAPRR